MPGPSQVPVRPQARQEEAGSSGRWHEEQEGMSGEDGWEDGSRGGAGWEGQAVEGSEEVGGLGPVT